MMFLTIMVMLTIVYLYFKKWFKYWENRNVPFIMPTPFVGNIGSGLTLQRSMAELFSDLYHKSTEPILGLFMFNIPCLLIRDPQIIQRMLVSDFEYFYNRNVMTNKRDDPVGSQGIFFLKNPLWKLIRSKLTPLYSSFKLKMMSNLIEEEAQKMIDYLKTQSNEFLLDAKDISGRIAVNVITSTAFGVNADSFTKNSRFYTEVKDMFNWDNFFVSFRIRVYFLMQRMAKLFRMRLFNPKSVDFLEESFWEVMKLRRESKTQRNDLIDILAKLITEDKQFMENDLLAAQAVLFFIAGFETTSSTISFALHEMAFNPIVQDKLRADIIELSAERGINYETIHEMEYLDLCVKEVLRKYPPLPFLDRKCASEYTISETGTVIEKDIPVFISVFGLHYDPEHFPCPDSFQPERFSEQNKDQIKKFTYLPFGEGPRSCIGERFGRLIVKIALANILKEFAVSPPPGGSQKLILNPRSATLAAKITIKLTKL